MTIAWSSNHEQLARLLEATPAELGKALNTAAGRTGKRFLSHHAKRFLRRGSKTGPGVRATQRFRKHFKADVHGTRLDNLTLDINVKTYVAHQQEHGATLHAKGAKLIVVPMPAALTKSGRVGKVARRLARARKLVVFSPRGGRQTFLAQRVRGSKRLKLLFHLQRRVRLYPRLQFYRTWRQEYRPKAMADFRTAVPYALAAARRKGAVRGK